MHLLFTPTRGLIRFGDYLVCLFKRITFAHFPSLSQIPLATGTFEYVYEKLYVFIFKKLRNFYSF